MGPVFLMRRLSYLRHRPKKKPRDCGAFFRWSGPLPLRWNGVALLDGRLGRSRFGRGLAFLLHRFLGVALLPRQLRGAQLPRPFTELVTHGGLLRVSMMARPSRLIRLVKPSYAPHQNVVHASDTEERRGPVPARKDCRRRFVGGPRTSLSDVLLFFPVVVGTPKLARGRRGPPV